MSDELRRDDDVVARLRAAAGQPVPVVWRRFVTDADGLPAGIEVEEFTAWLSADLPEGDDT